MSLPLAPDRAILSNRISLLLSQRASLLPTLNPPSSTSSHSTTNPRHHHSADDDEKDLARGNRPNEGVGYTAQANDARGASLGKEQRFLLGKRKGMGKGSVKYKGRDVEEEQEDEEPGRSGLGRKKRRREEMMEEAAVPAWETNDVLKGDDEEDKEGKGHSKEIDLVIRTTDGTDRAFDTDGSKKKKKKKKKNKKKNKKRKPDESKAEK